MKLPLSQDVVHNIGRFQRRKSPAVDVLNKVRDDPHGRFKGLAIPERQKALAQEFLCDGTRRHGRRGMAASSVADAIEVGEGAEIIGGIVAGTDPGGSVDHEASGNFADDDSLVAEDERPPFREEVCNRGLTCSRSAGEQIALIVSGQACRMEEERSLTSHARQEADFDEWIEQMHWTPSDLAHLQLRQNPGTHGPVVIGDQRTSPWLLRIRAQAFDDKSGVGLEQFPQAVGRIEPE